MAKTLGPKNFPGLSRQNIRSIHFINFFHSLFTCFFSVCLFSCNLFYRFIISKRSNWNGSWMNTLLQITLQNDLYTILGLFKSGKKFSYRPIIKNLRKILETTIFFFLPNKMCNSYLRHHHSSQLSETFTKWKLNLIFWPCYVYLYKFIIFSRVISISSCLKSYPNSIALRYLQRKAIMLDPNWQRGYYYGTGRYPRTGVKLAR